MLNIHDNEELKMRLMASITNVQTMSAFCVENDAVAIVVMKQVVISMVALQASIGLIKVDSTEDLEKQTAMVMEMLLEYRSACKSGDQDYINEVAGKWEKKADDEILSLDVLDGI